MRASLLCALMYVCLCADCVGEDCQRSDTLWESSNRAGFGSASLWVYERVTRTCDVRLALGTPVEYLLVSALRNVSVL